MIVFVSVKGFFLYIMDVNVTLFVGFYFVKGQVVVFIVKKLDMLSLKILERPVNIT